MLTKNANKSKQTEIITDVKQIDIALPIIKDKFLKNVQPNTLETYLLWNQNCDKLLMLCDIGLW